MSKKNFPIVAVTLEKIVGGGQALGTLDNGKKIFVWGGLPGETVEVQITKKKSHLVEGRVVRVITASPERAKPLDPETYLSTSPWQIMSFEAEQRYKAALINEAFTLHSITLAEDTSVYTDNKTTHYRNKVEFSWYSDTKDGVDTLDLAFFRRGSKGKVIVHQFSLLPDATVQLAKEIRDVLQQKNVSARDLKTLLIRSDQQGNLVWQLYVKTTESPLAEDEAQNIKAQGGEVIYSNPQSPASIISKRLVSTGETTLSDTILGIPFRYATEGFFQVNIPVYEQALVDMREWVDQTKPTVDLYSGVGSIGLTIGGDHVKLIEINEHAVREMRQNIIALKKENSAEAILSASEHALDYITSEAAVIVDPPRAGLHADVIEKLLEAAPSRIIYLSCNPVTQARDVSLLSGKYLIRHHKGYNFFPRTPHIEHLVILDKR